MAVYLVTYDIKKRNDFEYKPLWAALEDLQAVRTQESVWLLSNSASQKAIFDHFRPLVHEDDKLMVIKIYDKPSWSRGFAGTKDFIQKYWP